MSHPKELIGKIVKKLEVDYPPLSFEFIFEKQWMKTRKYPDIQVKSKQSEQIVCLVEIGYTRPEKLTAYRKKVDDVRWYGKDGKLHTEMDSRSIHERVIPSGKFYTFRGTADPCMAIGCIREVIGELNDEERAMAKAQRRDLMIDRLSEEVCATVITNYRRVWLVQVCDRCGGVEFSNCFALDEAVDQLKHHQLDKLETYTSWATLCEDFAHVDLDFESCFEIFSTDEYEVRMEHA